MSSAQSAPYKMSRTAASLSRRVARPRSACNRLSRVWVRSSWIGRAQTVRMLYIASHDAARKAPVSQPLLSRFFRRLLLIFLPPIRPFTVPTVGLGSCQCIVCPKTCCENRGQIRKVALFRTGAIEHSEHNRALSEQWSSAYYG